MQSKHGGDSGRAMGPVVPAFGDVIVILWIRLKSDLAPTIDALEVESAVDASSVA